MRAKEFIFEQREKLDLDELSRNPNVRVMLDLIARAEGNTDYNTLVGGGKFKDFSSHPNKTVYLRSRDRAGNVKIIPSDAAGRYQIMGFNWQPYAKKLGLKDFSPASQDKIAIQMLADRGALPAILKGDFKNAVKKTGSQWVSLPSTEIKQGYGPKSWKWVNDNVAQLSKEHGVDSSTQVAKVDTTKPSIVDKIRDVVSTATTPKTAGAEQQPKSNKQPGYYSVGDSHAQGLGGYSGKQWTNLGRKGSSAFEKQHLENIKNIPAGSVIALSLGANDLGSTKISDIVDQVNKTVAAAKAQGHQVVYLLPTASPDPKLQQKREELRQALVKSLDSRDIMDLGTAPSSKELRGGDNVHLSREGYKRYGDAITQMFTPGVKTDAPKADVKSTEHPVGAYVKPDWSKYEFGDLGTLEKIGPGKWRSDKGKIITNAPELEKLTAEPKPETYLDKIKNLLPTLTGAKNTAQATTKPSTEPPATTKTPTDVDIDFDVKPVSSPKSTNKTATNVDVDLVKPSSSPKSTTKTPTDVNIDFDTKSSSTPTKIGTEPKVDIRKDFERAFAAARKEKGSGETFDWTDPKTGKISSFTTDYSSEKTTP